MDLRRATGSPPTTTTRRQLNVLTEAGVIERDRPDDFPRAVQLGLTRVGGELLEVAASVERWLADAPQGGLQLGSAATQRSIKALLDGWSTGIIRVLAARPFSLTELDQVIKTVSYPSLERRLGAMRLAGQIERIPGPGSSSPYGITPWLRRAVGPLAAASYWERRNGLTDASPMTRMDVEAAFLLAVPLVSPPPQTRGTCRLAVRLQASNGQGLAGVLAAVDGGRVVSCITRIQEHAASWVSGSPSAWLEALIHGRATSLEAGGDSSVADALVDGLHTALFRRAPKVVDALR